MGRKVAIGLTALGLAGGMAAWWAHAAPERNVVRFSIEVTLDDEGGLEATCQEGCMWEKVSFSCDGKLPCKGVIDDTGVCGGCSREECERARGTE